MKSRIIACAASALTMLLPVVGEAQNSLADGGVDSIASRMANRDFPSIFAPWNVAENLRQSRANRSAIQLRDADGKPVASRPVFFHL
jgi:hypothetical protein